LPICNWRLWTRTNLSSSTGTRLLRGELIKSHSSMPSLYVSIIAATFTASSALYGLLSTSLLVDCLSQSKTWQNEGAGLLTQVPVSDGGIPEKRKWNPQFPRHGTRHIKCTTNFGTKLTLPYWLINLPQILQNVDNCYYSFILRLLIMHAACSSCSFEYRVELSGTRGFAGKGSKCLRVALGKYPPPNVSSSGTKI
jgi:hypothetical protein